MIIAGGGPAGLSAAAALARAGRSVTVLEQNHEIGSPIRTSGGSFIEELEALGIPARLYHPISRVRFLSPRNSAVFEYPVAPLLRPGRPRNFPVSGGARHRGRSERASVDPGRRAHYRTRRRLRRPHQRAATFRSRLVIDATGYRSALLKQSRARSRISPLRSGLRVRSVRAALRSERSGAAGRRRRWRPPATPGCFPGAAERVRVGVGSDPSGFARQTRRLSGRAWWPRPDVLESICAGAQPLEHHTGLIPSEQFVERFAGDGILRRR